MTIDGKMHNKSRLNRVQILYGAIVKKHERSLIVA